MVMHKPQSISVPSGFFDEVLKLRLAALKGKSVVYQVYKCPGFFMYLSDKGRFSHALVRPKDLSAALLVASEEVTISLRANITPPAAGTRSSVTSSWHHVGTTGLHQQAYRANAFYTPLYCLKSIQRPLLRRDEMDPRAAHARES